MTSGLFSHDEKDDPVNMTGSIPVLTTLNRPFAVCKGPYRPHPSGVWLEPDDEEAES